LKRYTVHEGGNSDRVSDREDDMADKKIALIVGAGRGLSASLARRLAGEGVQVALAARDTAKLDGLVKETSGRAYGCDATDEAAVEGLFGAVTADFGEPDLVVYNASGRTRGPIVELEADAVRNAIMTSSYAGFLVARAAARQMTARGDGAIFFTGASASVKGYANSSAFAMGKFALRGLCQSLARELHPQNIHIAHFVIDGGILQGPDDARAEGRGPDGMLHPDAIAETYYNVWRQHRSAWTWEVELRPWVEKF
jgi:NAD(P)-dependent dehydrogenase (short-subunit alcohol dehydrogenase family)